MISVVDMILSPLKIFRVPVSIAGLVLMLTFRFVPILFEEAQHLKMALLARGWKPGKSFVQKVQAWIPLMIPLLISALRRSDGIA